MHDASRVPHLYIHTYILIYIYIHRYIHNIITEREREREREREQITYKHIYTECVGAVHELLAKRELIGRLAVWDLLFNLV